jgi:Binding-protein-dependent transport system inner membrane component
MLYVLRFTLYIPTDGHRIKQEAANERHRGSKQPDVRSFFHEIPIDLEEAAMVDGASRLSAFWHVMLPLAAPGLVATAIFTIIVTYNEFFVSANKSWVKLRPRGALVDGANTDPTRHSA